MSGHTYIHTYTHTHTTNTIVQSSCSPSGISIHCTITRQDKINDIQKYDITDQDKNIQETKTDRKRTN